MNSSNSTIQTVTYPNQGNVVLQDGCIITIQLHGTCLFLCLTKASKHTLPIVHFVWKDCTLEEVYENARCKFLVENVDGDMLTLRSASNGEFLALKEHDDGYMATTQEDADVSTMLKVIHADNNQIRLVGHKK